ncbi:PREDICTED: protein MRG2-like [Camelina sativa]|uniref:Protein MRG2-like n=1 Tax=Camelina sativa TaxID=90675 RepID=A0ABM0WQT9_CAMSA|nr:PREDICTED: protein MRG2-like [Camelina sativa]
MGSPNDDAAAAETDLTTDSIRDTRRDSGSDTESNNDCDGDDLPVLLLPPPPGQFEEGERVLANHSDCFYEAKVLKIEYRDEEWKYFVHYIGWNKSWDEWISLDCLLKHTDENIEKEKEQGMKQGIKTATAWKVTKMKPRSPNVARGRKRKQDSADTEKNVVPSDNLLNFHIPPALRKQLIDDYEFVTQMHKLVQLPRSPNVDDILKKYVDSQMKKHGRVTDSVEEILKGLRCYFDKALPVMLLYNNERKQYEETVTADVSPSTVYGAEHLLRLFVKLPELLIHVNMAEETLKELQDNLADILRFLRKNQSLFFVSAYKAVEEIEKNED